MIIPELFNVYNDNVDYRAALLVMQKLIDHNYETYFVGGSVRDAYIYHISQKFPIDVDFDIVTSASPDQVKELFTETIPTGEAFNIMTVVINKIPVEVATFRKDGPSSDGRHPDYTETATVEEDSCRRDFTINSLYYNPFSGELLDFHNGCEDIEKKMLRFVGDPCERIEEDYLRMLRAVRFSVTKQLTMESHARKTIRIGAHRIRCISAERILKELKKILTVPNKRTAIEALNDTTLLKWLIPELQALKRVYQRADYHPEGDAYEHTLRVLDNLPTQASFELVVAAIFHDTGKVSTQTIDNGVIHFYSHEEESAKLARAFCETMKMSRESSDKIVWLVANHMRISKISEMRKGKAIRLITEGYAGDLLYLHRADALGSNGDLSNYNYAVNLLNYSPRKDTNDPPRMVTGHTLIEFGLKPSPVFSVILDESYTRQLEGRYETELDARYDILNCIPDSKLLTPEAEPFDISEEYLLEYSAIPFMNTTVEQIKEVTKLYNVSNVRLLFLIKQISETFCSKFDSNTKFSVAICFDWAIEQPAIFIRPHAKSFSKEFFDTFQNALCFLDDREMPLWLFSYEPVFEE